MGAFHVFSIAQMEQNSTKGHICSWIMQPTCNLFVASNFLHADTMCKDSCNFVNDLFQYNTEF